MTQKSNLKEDGLKLGSIYEDFLRENLDIPFDWKFLDSPWMTEEVHSKFMEAVKDHETKFVVGSSRTWGDSKGFRFTVFLSPDAVNSIQGAAKNI